MTANEEILTLMKELSDKLSRQIEELKRVDKLRENEIEKIRDALDELETTLDL